MSKRVIIAKREDYLRRLAYRNSLTPEELLEANPHLGERADPDLLETGEPVKIDEEPKTSTQVVVGESNEVEAAVPKVKVQLKLQDEAGPLKGEPIEIRNLDLDDPPTETDGNGRLEVEIPITVSEIKVFLPRRWRALSLEVGALAPIESELGVRQRLANLGHWAHATPNDEDEVELEPLADSVARWQADTGQEVSALESARLALEKESMSSEHSEEPDEGSDEPGEEEASASDDGEESESDEEQSDEEASDDEQSQEDGAEEEDADSDDGAEPEDGQQDGEDE